MWPCWRQGEDNLRDLVEVRGNTGLCMFVASFSEDANSLLKCRDRRTLKHEAVIALSPFMEIEDAFLSVAHLGFLTKS